MHDEHPTRHSRHQQLEDPGQTTPNPDAQPHGSMTDQIAEMESEGQAAKPGSPTRGVSAERDLGEPETPKKSGKTKRAKPAGKRTRGLHAPGEDGPPISPQDPSSMPRGEDDDETMARSPEFNDPPGSGKHRGV